MADRGSIVTRVVRRLRLLGDRFVYEVRRPELSNASVAARLAPDAGVDVTAPGGFRALLERHLRATPVAPAWRDAMRWDPAPDEVDWHLDRHFGVRWPRRFTNAMSDLLPGSDLNLLWHDNKMMPLLDLAARYARTGEPLLAQSCYRLMDSWCRQNPWRVGKNWRSPMEVGTRLVVWSLVLSAIRDAPAPDEDVCARLVRSVIRQADHLAGHFSAKEIPNNHLIGEAATLYAFAAYWPLLGDAPAWMDQAETVLEAEVRRQVLDDGFDFEGAVNYHVYVVDFLIVYLHAKALLGETPPRAVLDAAARMVGAALSLVSPAGRFPQVGDDSMTEFLSLCARPEVTGAEVGADALIRPGYAEVLRAAPWGAGLMERMRALENRRWFEDAGIAVFRRARSHATFVCGPQHARAFHNGHLHLDAGSFELEVESFAVFVDSGTWLYFYDAAARRHFRGASAHNTMVARDADPVPNTRTFGWQGVHTAQVLGVETGDEGSWVACERALGEGAGTHRRVFADLDGVWVVADAFTPAPTPGGGDVSVYFHTALAPGAVTLARADSLSLELPAGRERLEMDVVSDGDFDVELIDDPADLRTAFSRGYGDRRHGVTVRTHRPGLTAWHVAHVIRRAGVVVRSEGWRGGVLTLSGEDGTRAVIDLSAPAVRLEHDDG